MPEINTAELHYGACKVSRDADQPWLNFFREVRRLAAQLDALEQKKLNEDGERLPQ